MKNAQLTLMKMEKTMTNKIMPYSVVKFVGDELDWMQTKLKFADKSEELSFEESWGIIFGECMYEGICVWFKEIYVDDPSGNINYEFESFRFSHEGDYGDEELFKEEVSKVLVDVFKQGIKEYVESATEIHVS